MDSCLFFGKGVSATVTFLENKTNKWLAAAYCCGNLEVRDGMKTRTNLTQSNNSQKPIFKYQRHPSTHLYLFHTCCPTCAMKTPFEGEFPLQLHWPKDTSSIWHKLKLGKNT